MIRLITVLLLVLPSFSQALSVEMKIQEIAIEGTADREAVRRAFQSEGKKFDTCGISAGSLQIAFSAGETGQIKDAQITLEPQSNQATETCFRSVLSQVNLSFAGIQDVAKISLRFDIGKKEREIDEEKQRVAHEVSQSKVRDKSAKSLESESEKKNREYLEGVKADAIRKMNEQAARQNQQLQATLICNDSYKKDNLLEKYHQCLDQAKYGADISESKKTCLKSCEAQKSNREVSCQKCNGGTVVRQRCISSCQRHVADQTSQCMSGCR